MKQSECAVDRDMGASKIEAAAETARRLEATGTDFEVRTEHRSQHGSIYVTVRNASPPLIARIAPRLSPIQRWVGALVIAVTALSGLIAAGFWATGAWSTGYSSGLTASPSLAIEGNTSAVRFIDGDTLVVASVNGIGSEEKIRLMAIDTPERGKQWYSEAGSALKELVNNRPVHLEFETPGKLQRDKYGRILAYLIVDGRNVNIEMVRQGWTAYVTKYGGDRFAKDFVAAEEEARAAHRGIWSSR